MIRVSQQGDGATPLVLGNIRAPRNGYAYVYVSNESNEAVFFDDLKVQHRRSALLEETHYYPFGLTMAGISSKKLGSVQEGLLKNEYGYNEKELWDEADLNWYDYGFRNYDVQIGRFVQIDPLADISADNSGYHYALNDPIANIDYLGLSALDMVRCAWEMSSSLSNLLSVSSVITSIATGAINVAGTIANQQTVIAQGQQGPGLPQAPVQKGLDGFRSAVKAPISLAEPKSAFNERTILDEFVVWVRQRVRTLEHNIYMEDLRTNTTLLERIVKDVIDPLNWETGGFSAGANLVGKVSKQELSQAARKAAKEELDEMAVKGASKGTQVNSKTLWKGKGKERIDVENPNPSQRPGQIHYQDNNGSKYIYDPSSGTFKDAPKSVNDLLNNPSFKRGIDKGLEYLGIKL